MKNDNTFLMEQELMEAFTYTQDDASIGMPDLEAELRVVHKKAAKSYWQKVGALRIASVATIVVVAFGLGWSINSYMIHSETSLANHSENFCEAYVAGERITDNQQIQDLLAADIMNMNDEGDIVGTQLNDFFND